ncbi:uncharacterized protein [Lepeophtheirus salmonis]|nr:uncharacterized protein LOC121128412 [Lepeophtheirus salmonis]
MSNPTFKLASYNVHGWSDANYEENCERVAALIQKYDIDLVGFQESQGDDFGKVKSLLPAHEYVVDRTWNTSVLSRFPICDVTPGAKKFGGVRHNVVTSKIGNVLVHIVNVHFNHVSEERRLHELSYLKKTLQPLLSDARALQIWLGDFNALTREDYNLEEWNNLSLVRANNRWESPQVEFMNHFRGELGLIDIWAECGSPRPLGTCRFDTRIDYILASTSFLAHFNIIKFDIVDSNASDHRMIYITVQPKIAT